MTMWLSGFAAMDAPDLRLAYAEHGGKFALPHLAFHRPDFIDLGIGQFGMMGIFAGYVAAFARAVSIALVIRKVWHEFFATRGTCFGRMFNAACLVGIVQVSMVLTGDDLQIFDSIILLVAILVVDYLAFFERAAKMFAHDKTMNKDVAIYPCVGMLRLVNHEVLAMRQTLAVVPSRISFAAMGMTRQVPGIFAALEPVIRWAADLRDALAAAASALNVYCISSFAHVAHYITHGVTRKTMGGVV